MLNHVSAQMFDLRDPGLLVETTLFYRTKHYQIDFPGISVLNNLSGKSSDDLIRC